MQYRVDSSDLTSVADAIRTKGDTSASLLFPAGFVSAIQDINAGGSTLTTKNIIANGTYSASSDSADGYSEVVVAVPLNQPYITGTFTGSTAKKGTAKTITLPYVGNGYPIACLVHPTDGTYKNGSDFYNLIRFRGLQMWGMTKSDVSATPLYSNSGEFSNASVMATFKNSDTDSTQFSTTQRKDARVYFNSDATGSGNPYNALIFKSNTTMSVWIVAESDDYGFLDGIEYTYHIVYSE